jgi:hypothetical protein
MRSMSIRSFIRFFSLLSVPLFLCSCQKTNAQEGITRVWAVDDGQKVLLNKLDHWAATSPQNPIWDGQAIRLFGSRNEFVAFQLILEASGSGAQGISVRLDSLSTEGAVLKNGGGVADPYDFVGKRIEMFLAHYLEVPDRSSWNATWGWWGARPLPDADYTGWIPDPLIPFEAPAGDRVNGQGGVPFRIYPGTAQTVWVDIFVPRNQKPGLYTGSLKVLENGIEKYEIPVFLRVYDLMLPDETHLKNFFYFGPSLLEMHPGVVDGSTEYYDLLHRYMNLAHRHRVNLCDGVKNLSSFSQNLGGYYRGDFFAPQFHYEGPGENVGETMYGIGIYDQPNQGYLSGFDPATPEAWQSAADRWESWFAANTPSVVRFKYMLDEPRPEDVPTVVERGSWLRDNSGPGKNLGIFCATRLFPDLFGVVNIWAVTGQAGVYTGGISSGYDLGLVKEMKSRGNLVGAYNGSRPSFGQASALDAPATENRVNPWIFWKYDVDFYFLFDVAGYAFTKINPWADQKIVIDGTTLWGDGTWIYAGEDKYHPGDSRGLKGPIASIRMKNWRRGEQDYEYLWMARQAGLDTREIVDQVVPHAFNDYGGGFTDQTGQPVWGEKGYQFERARRSLADLLAASAGTLDNPVVAVHVYPSVLPAGGGDVRVTWTIEGAPAGAVDHGVGDVPARGSVSVHVDSTTTFTLAASAAGLVRSAKAVVTVRGRNPVQPQGNLLFNPGFDNGTIGWTFQTDGNVEFTTVSPGYQSGTAARIAVTEMKNTLFFAQPGLPAVPRSQYRLRFAARSNLGLGVDVSFVQGSVEGVSYGLLRKNFDLTPDWKEYSVEFLSQNVADSTNSGTLVFDLTSSAVSDGEYMFDAITFEREAAPIAENPTDFQLGQNFPNPFNPVTRIQYRLPALAHVQLKIFNMLGEEVATLVDGMVEAGPHQVLFDASSVSSGMYAYRLIAGDFIETRKMLVVK